MALGKRGRVLLVSAVFAAALVAVGLAGISSSNYKDVSQLAMYNELVRGVTVKGTTVMLEPGVYTIKVGDAVLKMTISRPSPYGVAKVVAGSLGKDDEYAVFVLQGRDGYRVLALFSARTFISNYGAQPVMESSVVVLGTYDPRSRAVIVAEGASGARNLGSLPVFMVDSILEGCHSSYGSGVAKA